MKHRIKHFCPYLKSYKSFQTKSKVNYGFKRPYQLKLTTGGGFELRTHPWTIQLSEALRTEYSSFRVFGKVPVRDKESRLSMLVNISPIFFPMQWKKKGIKEFCQFVVIGLKKKKITSQ